MCKLQILQAAYYFVRPHQHIVRRSAVTARWPGSFRSWSELHTGLVNITELNAKGVKMSRILNVFFPKLRCFCRPSTIKSCLHTQLTTRQSRSGRLFILSGALSDNFLFIVVDRNVFFGIASTTISAIY